MNSNAIEINSYLSFSLGEETFAAHVGKVLEILEVKKITRVPRYPAYMKGVTNLRGTVLPVVDMRVKFGMEPAEPTLDTCIIVMTVDIEKLSAEHKAESITIGALVDGVREVLEIDKKLIIPPPILGLKCRPEFLDGIWKKDDIFIMLLNIDLVFSIEEIPYITETDQQYVEKNI